MQSRYVIFADDDADDLELITGFFKQFNRSVNVLEFRDGKEVLAFLEDYANNTSLPLLLVLDINMPGLNGLETLAIIRKHKEFRHLPVVIYTTSTNSAEQEYCESLDASWVRKSDSLDGIRQTARILAEFCILQD
jgi:CheY-like chemotaxis protein